MTCSSVLCPTPTLISPFIKHLLCTRDHIQETVQGDSARVHVPPAWVPQAGQPWLLWPCCHDRTPLSQSPTFPGTAVLQQLAGRSSLVEEAAVAHSW